MLDEKKKTAALNPSAPTDGGQLSHENNKSIPETTEKSNPHSRLTKEEADALYQSYRKSSCEEFLATKSMEELFDEVYDGKTPIIDGLLYEGAYLFAGAPKVGKSFFMAQIGYHVSTGLPLFDQRVRQGEVLYLALEDDYKRLQSRLFRMYGVEATPDFHFAIHARQMGEGLEGQITNFLKDHKKTKLIILDTLQKVRPVERESCSYSLDYAIIGRIKALADQHHICILLVHHTRKDEATSGQRFARISGTNGLFGAADGAFLMEIKPQESNAVTLDVVGRDQPERRLYLKRDLEHLTWQFVEEEANLWKEPADPVLEKIVAFIVPENPEWRGTATELVEQLAVDLKPNALSMLLNVRSQRLLDEYKIEFKSTRDHAGRRIELKLLELEA